MARRPKEAFTREIEPGVVVFSVDAQPPAAARPLLDDLVSHARETAVAIRRAVAARRARA
jgi:hypothetical protein